MTNIELNAVLYYADFLSLQAISIPVTDNCKYFYIHNNPINSCYILDLEPVYDQDNQYFQQALQEYHLLHDKFGEDGVSSFVEKLANLSACGAVTGEQMLKYIHHYSNRIERKQAFKTYQTWKNNKKYFHTTINEDGRPEERECSMYTYHVERMLERRGVSKSNGYNTTRYEKQTLEPLL